MKIVLITFMSAVLCGCATSSKNISQAGMGVSSQSEAQFKTKLLGRTSASVDVFSIFYIPLEFGTTQIGLFGGFFPTFDAKNIAIAKAKYHAIEKIPAADALVGPRVDVETYDFLGIFQINEVTVKGQAIQYVE